MKFKPWSSLSLSDKGRLVGLTFLGLVGVSSILFPNGVIGLIGTFVGFFAIMQSGLFLLDIFIRNKTQQVIPSQLLIQAAVYGIIGILLIILPTDAMKSILGYLIILGLLFFALFQWNLTRHYVIKKQAWAHYLWMALAIITSLVVAFNLNTVTTFVMVLLGIILVFYSVANLFTLLIDR